MSPALRLALVLVVLVLGMVSRPAAASDPSSIYTVPSVVEILPDDATGTRVVIGGAFFFLTAPMTFTYSEPKCGYMSFQCPPGKEVMCRMQWLDIRKAIGGPYCAGFGTLNMISTATLRTDRGGTPDPWDLGMGIAPGQHVDGKCPPARLLKCPLTPGSPPDATAPLPADGGAVMDAPPPAPDTGSAPPTPSPDAGSAPVAADAAAPAVDAAVLAADAAPAATLAKSDGCAVGGRGASAWPLGAALVLALALGRRARRR